MSNIVIQECDVLIITLKKSASLISFLLSIFSVTLVFQSGFSVWFSVSYSHSDIGSYRVICHIKYRIQTYQIARFVTKTHDVELTTGLLVHITLTWTIKETTVVLYTQYVRKWVSSCTIQKIFFPFSCFP